MKLSHGLGFAGFGLGVVGAALGWGCSSSGGSSGSVGPGDTCEANPGKCIVQPPVPSNAAAATVTAAHNYAMHKLYLGDTDRTGTPSQDAWKAYGYNLDDKITTKDSTDVCTLAQGALRAAQTDGNGGIDNSFGENILPIVLTTAGNDASTKINNSINTGSFTVMTYVKGFDDSAGNKTSATGLTGVLLAGGNYASATDGGMPTWDMSTHWPIRPELLTCGPSCPPGSDPIADAKIKFPMAYQAGGTFVNGSPGSLDLSLSIGGQSLDISIHSALVTFDPKAPGHVTNGTIAGVINTEELISSLKTVAGHISTSLCAGSAFESIASQIQQASDIVINSDGSVSNPAGTPCNGISIGLGFDADEIALPTPQDIAGPTPPAPDPCAMDGGTG
jgi:hypothetical protein